MVSFEGPKDMYADEEIARVRYPNIFDNDFSEGNCEHCYGVGYINTYCGRCFRIENCTFKNGKLETIKCPTFAQFMSINGKYLFNEYTINKLGTSGKAKSLYPEEIMENGNAMHALGMPTAFKDWKRIKFVAGGPHA